MRETRSRLLVGGALGVVMALTWALGAYAQTTTGPTTTPTTARTTSTTRATTTSRPVVSSTTSTTRPRPAVRLSFSASPGEGPPGTSIGVSSINQCRGVGSFYVLLSIGDHRLGSGPADRVGNWRFQVTVPQLTPGTYGLAATCLISRNGVDENAGIYSGPDFTVTAGQGPTEPTTPAANKSEKSNTALLIGLIVAVVIAIAAIAWALVLRSRHRRAAMRPGGMPPPA